MTSFIESNQEQDIPVTSAELPYGSLRYLYARSSESRSSGAKGQDYLSWRNDAQTLCFVICDGVGSSFCGHVAAKYLGGKLLEFMSDMGPTLEQIGDLSRIREFTSKYLSQWRSEGDRLVQEEILPDHLPRLQLEALQQLRNEHGSETVFVCGRLSYGDSSCKWPNRLTLIWMGDTEVRVYDPEGRAITLGGVWRNADRWSTKYGVGKRGVTIYAWVGDIERDRIGRIIAFSDGIAFLADELLNMGDTALQETVNKQLLSPTSDDISLLDIRLDPRDADQRIAAPLQLKADRSQLVWLPVNGASGYQLEESDSGVFHHSKVVLLDTPEWSLAESQYKASAHRHYRVRALSADRHGPWSRAFSLLPPRPDPPQLRLSPFSADVPGTYTAQWERVDGAQYYVLRERVGTSAEHVVYVGTNVQYTLNGQAPGIYHYLVDAWGVAGPSQADDSLERSREVPPNLTLNTQTGSDAQVVSWSQGAKGQKYVLERSRQDTFDNAETAYQGPDASWVSQRRRNEPWYYRVRLLDGGLWSNTVALMKTMKPPFLSIEGPDTLGEYTFRWAVEDPDDMVVLEEATSPEFRDVDCVSIVPLTDWRFSAFDHKPGDYYFRVRTQTTSDWSNIVRLKVAEAAVAPLVSENGSIAGEKISADDMTKASALLSKPILEVNGQPKIGQNTRLTWSQVAQADCYDLQCAYGDILRDSGNYISTYRGDARTVEVRHSEPKGYYYRVRAMSGGRAGPWSEIVSVVIKPGPPTAPFLHLIDNPDGAGGYDVIWAPVAHSEWYELEERKYAMVLPGGWYPLELGSSIKILRASVSVVDHRPGKYLYRVRACNASGCSGYSNEVSTEVRVLPLESPQMEEIDNPRGDDGYTIHWKQVDGANSYVLEESRTADFQSGQIIYRGRSESWTVWKKPPGDYSYRVFARDLAENCAQSGPSNTVTTRVRIVPPSWRPWEEDRKNGELWLQVKWCPVVWAVKYEIKRTDRREVWVVKKTSHEFAMKAQAQYVFQVRAVSDRNVYSDWSRPKIAIVEYDPRVGYLRVTDAKEL